jgi:hypothetical protein
MSAIPPLNGTKTHPLSKHALSALERLMNGPEPRQTINPGVVNRLEREALVETVMLPSPYQSHKGALTSFLKITDAGRAARAAASI